MGIVAADLSTDVEWVAVAVVVVDRLTVD